MKWFVTELLSESGAISTTRVMSLLSLGIGAIIAIGGLLMDKDPSGVAQICGIFVGSSFAAKVTQKYMESK